MTESSISAPARIALAAELTAAWLANPHTRAGIDDAPAFLRAVHDRLAALTGTDAGTTGVDNAALVAERFERAVSVRKSLASPEHIISMIDGKPYRSLTRHLRTNGLTPDEYRARYRLRPDYPMVAPGYTEARRATAKAIGLGRRERDGDEQREAPTPEPTADLSATGVGDTAESEPQRDRLRVSFEE